ncbi:mycothiol synthase [Dietzia sp. 179-F 9C3 NHS]|uniref:mycothiol synthase n=1 Tax=Dietzia sp. 179-F 9C3 NHS TaxID=3374295 RepID=UPI003879CF31
MTTTVRELGTGAVPAGIADAVEAIAEAAHAADGVEPLGEQPLRALRAAGGPGVRHLVAEDPDAGIVGYAQLTGAGAEASAELVVVPEHRRRGTGAALVRAVAEREPAAAIWAHGDLAAARGLAATLGLERTRELLKMRRRRVDGPELPPAGRRDGIETGTLAEAASEGGARWPGLDARAEFLRVNNAAFSWHPEQGGWSRAQLDDRLAVDWVDPAGIFLAVDTTGPGPRLAGFHWTKVAPTPPGDLAEGEVYVVAVDPADQGRGLGGLLTVLGVAHLERAVGATSVVLYVEGDNVPARRTYERLGFAVDLTDVTYTPARGPSQGLKRH